MSVSISMVGRETKPNSNMNVKMFRKNSCFRKTKKEVTPLPKRPADGKLVMEM